MKKLLTILMVLTTIALFSNRSYAQAYKNGDKLLNATIGLNSYYSRGLPLGASLEVGITDNISVGGAFDFTSWKYPGTDYGYTFLYFGARGSYHVGELLKIDSDKFDPYGGLGIGYYTAKYNGGSSVYSGSYGSNIYFFGYVGARYYFAEKLGAVVELGGGGVSNIKAGITFKL